MRPDNALKRKWIYAEGLLQASSRLYALRKKESNLCVYSKFSGGRFAMFYRYLHAIGYPVAQEVNEWWPGTGERSRRDRELRTSQGAVAISRPIIARLRNLPSYNREYRILHVPILIDTDEWAPSEALFQEARPGNIPYVLWCGNMDCADEDIQFLLQVAKAVNDAETCRLMLVGRCSPVMRDQICGLTKKFGFREDLLDFPGYVSDNELNRLMSGATALLLPLWETERSMCRFPTKLGHYLASGTPVVTTAQGDLTLYLKDGNSACMVSPGDVAAFAGKVIFLLQNAAQAKSIGMAGRSIAKQHFSIDAHKVKLARFFSEMAK